MDRPMGEVYSLGIDLATDPKYTIWVITMLLIAEAVLSALIIKTVPYTETVLQGYVQHAQQYMAGVKDYTVMNNDDGEPFSRPALHVYICRFVASISDQGTMVLPVQTFFSCVYMFNLGLAMLCYKQAKVPNYVYPILCLSKRLHSLYLLRCYDDVFVMTFLFLAIYMYQQKNWTAGSLAFACGLGVDISLLCALPAVAIILVQALGIWGGAIQVSNLLQLQMVLAVPFLQGNFKAYVLQVFGGLRRFREQDRVNWRFVSLDRLMSQEFALGLLILQITIIVGFFGSRWLQRLNRSFPDALKRFFTTPTEKDLEERANKVTPEFVLTTMLTTIAVSLLCARSIQYESLVWIAWATPFLFWRSGLNPALQYLIWSGQELAWNQIPANELSSQLIAGILAVAIVQTWIATDVVDEDRAKQAKQQIKPKGPTPRLSKKLEQEAEKIVHDPEWPM